MLRILKNEIMYNLYHLIAAVIIPIAVFIIMIAINSTAAGRVTTLSKIIFPIVIGFGPVIYIAGIGAKSVYEKRIFRNSLLPVTNSQIAIAKMLFITLPLLLLFVILIFSSSSILGNAYILTEKTIYSCGIYFLLIAFLSAGYDAVNLFRVFRTKYFNLLFNVMLVVFVAIVLLPDFMNIAQLSQLSLGVIYFLLGLVVMLIDIILFIKRKSYLV